MIKNKSRKITNEDVTKYEPMIEKFIRDSCVKNWKEASLNKNSGEISLGNTGMSLDDIRQHLRAELCIALYNYNPDFKTKDGRSVKESTFVFAHLRNRIGQTLKRLTHKKLGYGRWIQPIEEAFWETSGE